MDFDNIRVTGVMFYYYFICYRKLWYFYKNIQMEQNDENVEIGKIIDINSYSREKKNIMINETISIDFIENKKIIHEVKKSKSIEESGIWQLKYYMYYLKQNGISDIKGVIDYPLLKKRENIDLTAEDEEKILIIIDEIKNIVEKKEIPVKIDNKICRKCSYYELCYI